MLRNVDNLARNGMLNGEFDGGELAALHVGTGAATLACAITGRWWGQQAQSSHPGAQFPPPWDSSQFGSHESISRSSPLACASNRTRARATRSRNTDRPA